MTGIIESLCPEVADFFINIVADKIINRLTGRKRDKGQKAA